MATATKFPAAQRTERAPSTSELVVVEDNGGSHRWTRASPDGAILARSHSLASREEAENSIQQIHENIASARPTPRVDRGRLADAVPFPQRRRRPLSRPRMTPATLISAHRSQQRGRAPAWHALRLFGAGRHNAFESGNERADAMSSAVLRPSERQPSPHCGTPPKPVEDPETVIGFRLSDLRGVLDGQPAAKGIALPQPRPEGTRS